jgi:hypothetical protein
LEWNKYIEHGTEFIKASTSPDSIADQLDVFIKTPEKQKKKFGKLAREWAINKFSIKNVGKNIEKFIDQSPFIDQENEENFSKVLTDLKIDHCFWDGESNPPYEKNDNKVFFIGKIYTALKIKQLGYSYQVWLGPEFDYSYFGSHLNNLLNDDFLMGTCSQINKVYLTDNSIPPNEMVYIRSNSGYKRFAMHLLLIC